MGLEKMALGAYGESCAVRYLASCGMRIVDRNWRWAGGKEERAGKSLGEIDIVAQDGDGVLVIVEVKTRSGSGFGSPEQAVGFAKYRRLRRLGARWVEEHDLRPREMRIDVVAVQTAGGEAKIHHTVGAFR